MKIIDASGPIYNGMWSYGPPYPEFDMVEIDNPEWVDFTAYSQEFRGLSTVTGTYIDGAAHALGLEKSYPISDIPVERLFGIDAHVLRFDLSKLKKEGKRPCVTLEDVRKSEEEEIPDGAAIIFATGWGKHWRKDDYLKSSWFLRKDAVEYLVSKKPSLFAADTPYFDNVENMQGIWDLIFGNDVLIVAPLINIEKISGYKVKLYISPLKVLDTTGLPCRVMITEEDAPGM